LLKELVVKYGANDTTVRGTALQELEQMQVRTSQYNPDESVPEKSWAYRLAKRFFYNDFGVYDGHDHRDSSAPALLDTSPEAPTEVTDVPVSVSS
jgi:hypothetical protein